MISTRFFAPKKEKEKREIFAHFVFLFRLHFNFPMETGAETANAGGVQQPPVRSPPPRLEMSMTVLPDGTCIYRRVVPPAPAAIPGAGDGTPMRVGVMKKRGRPRRYRPSRPVVARIASSSVTSPVAVRGLEDDGFMSGSAPVGTVSPLAAMAALGTRESLTPYAINIKAGLDISSIISSFSQQGHVSVLSGNGVVSQVVLHQEANLGGTIAYEGRFEILLLSGQLLGENDLCSQTGGLTVLLAGPNSRVFGGRLAGILIAASPVQVIVGSFISDGY